MAITLNGTTGIVTPDVNSTGGITVDNDGATVATFDRASSDGTIVDLQKDGTTVGSIGTLVGYLTIGTDDTGLLFQDDANFLGPWNPSTNSGRDAAIDLGTGSGGRFKDLYLSGGVYLGGTGAANYLEDYEEGDWTPTFSFSSGSVGYDRNEGQYTKVGNQVSVTFAIALNSVSSPSGGLTIAGLPFTSGAGEKHISAVTFGIIRSLTTDQKTARGYVARDATTVTLSFNATNTSFSGWDANVLTSSTLVYGSIVYQTA